MKQLKRRKSKQRFINSLTLLYLGEQMDLQAALNWFNEKVSAFFTFIAGKLKNFKGLSLGEQIAFPCVGLGLLLIVISSVMLVLF